MTNKLKKKKRNVVIVKGKSSKFKIIDFKGDWLPNLHHAVKTRRKKLNKTWQSKEWKEKRLAFINGRGCSWCGSKEYLTVHHPYRSAYGKDLYIDFYLSGCVVLCRKCHSALHVGKTLCECKKHYRPFDADMCFPCYCIKFPEALEKVKAYKEAQKASQKAYRKKRYQESKKKQLEWRKDHPLPKRKKITWGLIWIKKNCQSYPQRNAECW